jgi:hypothetical protein
MTFGHALCILDSLNVVLAGCEVFKSSKPVNLMQTLSGRTPASPPAITMIG